jgi:hypothetical protein
MTQDSRQLLRHSATSRYPEHAAKALVIDTSWSYCGACGKGAYPQQQAHIDVAGWTPIPKGGCGCRWEHVTSSYSGPGIKKAATDMRPDLEWIDLYGPPERRLGTLLRSLDTRDDSRVVRIIEVHDDRIRVENTKTERRTFLKFPLKGWHVDGA